MFRIFWDFVIVEQMFLSLQVKQSVIIGKKLVYTIKNDKKLVPLVRYFTWKLEFVSNILWMIVDIWYIFNKTLVHSLICDEGGSNDKKIFKEESTDILKNFGLINNMSV